MNKHKITIITACSRPANLSIMLNSLKDFVGNWLVVLDSMPDLVESVKNELISEKTAIEVVNCMSYKEDIPQFFKGQVVKNFGINVLSENQYNSNNYVYFLDDDNILHPDFYANISETIEEHPDLITFQLQAQRFQLAENNIHVGGIDQAQYVVRFGLIADERIPHVYEGDGMFVQKLSTKSLKTIMIPKILSFYNKINWLESSN